MDSPNPSPPPPPLSVSALNPGAVPFSPPPVPGSPLWEMQTSKKTSKKNPRTPVPAAAPSPPPPAPSTTGKSSGPSLDARLAGAARNPSPKRSESVVAAAATATPGSSRGGSPKRRGSGDDRHATTPTTTTTTPSSSSSSSRGGSPKRRGSGGVGGSAAASAAQNSTPGSSRGGSPKRRGSGGNAGGGVGGSAAASATMQNATPGSRGGSPRRRGSGEVSNTPSDQKRRLSGAGAGGGSNSRRSSRDGGGGTPVASSHVRPQVILRDNFHVSVELPRSFVPGHDDASSAKLGYVHRKLVELVWKHFKSVPTAQWTAMFPFAFAVSFIYDFEAPWKFGSLELTFAAPPPSPAKREAYVSLVQSHLLSVGSSLMRRFLCPHCGSNLHPDAARCCNSKKPLMHGINSEEYPKQKVRDWIKASRWAPAPAASADRILRLAGSHDSDSGQALLSVSPLASLAAEDLAACLNGLTTEEVGRLRVGGRSGRPLQLTNADLGSKATVEAMLLCMAEFRVPGGDTKTDEAMLVDTIVKNKTELLNDVRAPSSSAKTATSRSNTPTPSLTTSPTLGPVSDSAPPPTPTTTPPTPPPLLPAAPLWVSAAAPSPNASTGPSRLVLPPPFGSCLVSGRPDAYFGGLPLALKTVHGTFAGSVESNKLRDWLRQVAFHQLLPAASRQAEQAPSPMVLLLVSFSDRAVIGLEVSPANASSGVRALSSTLSEIMPAGESSILFKYWRALRDHSNRDPADARAKAGGVVDQTFKWLAADSAGELARALAMLNPFAKAGDYKFLDLHEFLAVARKAKLMVQRGRAKFALRKDDACKAFGDGLDRGTSGLRAWLEGEAVAALERKDFGEAIKQLEDAFLLAKWAAAEAEKETDECARLRKKLEEFKALQNEEKKEALQKRMKDKQAKGEEVGGEEEENKNDEQQCDGVYDDNDHGGGGGDGEEEAEAELAGCDMIGEEESAQVVLEMAALELVAKMKKDVGA